MIKVFEFNIDGRTIYAASDFKGSLPMPTKQGYFLTNSELEQLKREYFKAGRMLDYLDPDIIYPSLSYKTFEDYEAQRLSSKKKEIEK